MAVCSTLFSRYQGVPPAVSGETLAQKVEEKIKRLERENAQLRGAKKEAASHRAQMEKELKRLTKVSADHERALRRAVEKAVADYSNSEEGRNFLQAYWASKVDEYKKSDDFQREVAKVAVPFVGYGFNACKEQFLVIGPFLLVRSFPF
ncbi:UNVERIFIED_CONTAM: hypothetical protein Slati_2497300 [Sesamum latifolium]|uniref:Uncharacterized protein n=1 Tax=Sesamum latifolium TaxID=2727402 RepID=A0AAW2WEI8_9LAMI